QVLQRLPDHCIAGVIVWEEDSRNNGSPAIRQIALPGNRRVFLEVHTHVLVHVYHFARAPFFASSVSIPAFGVSVSRLSCLSIQSASALILTGPTGIFRASFTAQSTHTNKRCPFFLARSSSSAIVFEQVFGDPRDPARLRFTRQHLVICNIQRPPSFNTIPLGFGPRH